MPGQALQLATAGAVAGGVVLAGAAFASNYATKHTTDLVVFLDGSQKGLKLPRQDSIPLLIASLEQQLHVVSPRLFLLQVNAMGFGGYLERYLACRRGSVTDLQSELHNGNTVTTLMVHMCMFEAHSSCVLSQCLSLTTSGSC